MCKVKEAIINEYQAALNKMANEILNDVNYDSSSENSCGVSDIDIINTLAHLNIAYNQFTWHYSSEHKQIHHTLNINTYLFSDETT